MENEIKDLVGQINANFEEFKTVQENGNKETAANLNASMDELRDEIKSIKVAAARSAVEDATEAKADVDSYQAKMSEWLRTGSDEVKGALLATTPPQEGGYLIAPELERNVEMLLRELTPARMYCGQQTISGAYYEKTFQTSHTAGGWIGERTPRANTDTPDFDRFRIDPFELYANPQVTEHELADAFINVESMLAMDVAETLSILENGAIVNGDGVGKPTGYANRTGAVGSTRVIKEVAAGTAGIVNGDDLFALIYDVLPQYRQGASFVMNRMTLQGIRTLKNADDSYLFQPMSQLDGTGVIGTILGHPVYEDEAIQDAAKPIFYGNFKKGVKIIDRTGLGVLRNPYRNPGFVEYYTRKRVGSDVEQANALRALTV